MSLAQDLRHIQKVEREKANIIDLAIKAVARLLQLKAKANPNDTEATLTLEQLSVPKGYEKVDVLGSVYTYLVAEGFNIKGRHVVGNIMVEITFGW